ncbi:MAG TPA: hypothetical protein VE443_04420 [Beijerinckiaceae bacterium]|jgi:hypothetical protein|nr:hypothetical protein [Beijerinckiaceae bacterium]
MNNAKPLSSVAVRLGIVALVKGSPNAFYDEAACAFAALLAFFFAAGSTQPRTGKLPKVVRR